VIYSVTTGKPVKSVADPCEGSPAGLTAFPNGQSIAASCYDDAVIVNISTGKFTTLAEPVDTAILAIAVSPNSKYVAVGLNNYSDPPSVGRVQLFSAATGTLIDTFVGSNSSVWSVAFSSDSETIAAGSSNGVLNFWSISSPAAPEQTYNQETGDTSSNGPSVSAIAYSADNQHVYYGRNDASSVLIDNPVYFPIASLALSKGSAIGGTSLVGTATLTVAAPSYGAKVFLTSSNSAAAEVPASITIPNGQTSGRFAITTTAQTAPTTVTIGANSTGTVQTASLTVLPQPVLTAITLSPSSVTGGGSTTNNTVTLSSAAPSAGVRVTLASSDPDVAKPPASVVVPAGATVSPAFTITTHRVSAETNVTISATYDGITRQATLIVK
jgi:WD40 repeat protein